MAKTAEKCSFCGRQRRETRMLISGVDAHICDSCIQQAQIILAGKQGFADTVKTGNEFSRIAQNIEHTVPDTGHDVHVGHDIWGISDLDADFSDRRSHRAHRERDHVHRTSPHAAGIEFRHRGLQLGRVYPVVGRARIFFRSGSDVGAVFHTGHIGSIGPE